ncbi:MAG: GTPase Era [Clostridia bacterium]|nr:GTPase Era [Clostridia bacterium]
MANFISGWVAVVGRPNVGKSTLINALVGEKVSIVSPKPQTTRNKILGILNEENAQVVFVDTPGIQSTATALGQAMRKQSTISKGEADVVLVVLDAGRVNSEDFKLIERYKNAGMKLIVVINKTDKVKPDRVFPILEKLNAYSFVDKFVSLSALTKKNVDYLKETILSMLPEGDPLFDREIYTDKSLRFMVSEIVREKALLFLQEEIPHGIAVVVDEFEEKKTLVKISATVVVANANHKAIVIGAGGEMLKKIGSSARRDIEKLTDKKVLLELFVRVEKNWLESASFVGDILND